MKREEVSTILAKVSQTNQEYLKSPFKNRTLIAKVKRVGNLRWPADESPRGEAGGEPQAKNNQGV